MGLLEDFNKVAFDQTRDQAAINRYWNDYFQKEKSIYEKLLSDPDKEVSGTVGELAKEYGITPEEMAGFLDGINTSLVKENDLTDLTEDSEVSLAFDKESLYKNMVDARAEWLYELPMWDDIFTKEKQKELFLEQRKSGTVHNEKKIGRNDPCPCGSGKKYKYCHGKK